MKILLYVLLIHIFNCCYCELLLDLMLLENRFRKCAWLKWYTPHWLVKFQLESYIAIFMTNRIMLSKGNERIMQRNITTSNILLPQRKLNLMFCVFITYSVTNWVFWVSKIRPRVTEYCMDSTEFVVSSFVFKMLNYLHSLLYRFWILMKCQTF